MWGVQAMTQSGATRAAREALKLPGLDRVFTPWYVSRTHYVLSYPDHYYLFIDSLCNPIFFLR